MTLALVWETLGAAFFAAALALGAAFFAGAFFAGAFFAAVLGAAFLVAAFLEVFGVLSVIRCTLVSRVSPVAELALLLRHEKRSI